MRIAINNKELFEKRAKFHTDKGSFNYFYNGLEERQKKATELKNNTIIEAEIEQIENYPPFLTDFDVIVELKELPKERLSIEQKRLLYSNVFATMFSDLWNEKGINDEDRMEIIDKFYKRALKDLGVE